MLGLGSDVRTLAAARPWSAPGIVFTAIAVVLYVAGVPLARQTVFPEVSVALFWFPTAIFAGLIARLPLRWMTILVPGVLLAEFIGTQAFEGVSITTVWFWMLATGAEAVGVGLVLKAIRANQLRGPFDLLKFAVAVPVVVAATACLGGLAVVMSFGTQWSEAFRGWWLGDVTGMLIACPFILSVAWPRAVTRERVIEYAAMCVLTLGTALWVFTTPVPSNQVILRAALLVPMLGWIALRLGVAPVAAVAPVVVLIAAICAAASRGPFEGTTPDISLLVPTQAFLALACLTLYAAGTVTEAYRRSQAALIEQTQQREHSLVSLVLDASPDAVIAAGDDGRIVLANRQADLIFGYPPGALVGNPIDILVPPRLRRTHAGHRAHYVAEPYTREMGQDLKLEAVRADGSRMPVEISLSPVDDDGRQLTIVSVRDVTERRRMSRELERSNQDLRQFAYLASHDLQAPLRTVAGFTQLLLQEKSGTLTARQQELADQIEAGVSRMQWLIRDLLAYSRIDGASAPMERVPIQAALTQAEQLLAADIDRYAAVITEDVPDLVLADFGQLRQVLQNLVQNSLTHSDPSRRPEIVVTSTQLATGMVEIRVADNGQGIPPEHRQAVFEMFKQLHAGDGTGMGLAMVKRITERHKGTVFIDPACSGIGTEVVVTLPAG